MITEESVLARKITLNGKEYSLQYLKIIRDKGEIKSLTLSPYKEELPFCRYIDIPLIAKSDADGKWILQCNDSAL